MPAFSRSYLDRITAVPLLTRDNPGPPTGSKNWWSGLEIREKFKNRNRPFVARNRSRCSG